MSYFICSICKVKFNYINAYFKHIIYTHSFSKTEIICPYINCLKNYINPHSLKKHINRKHYYENRQSSSNINNINSIVNDANLLNNNENYEDILNIQHINVLNQIPMEMGNSIELESTNQVACQGSTDVEQNESKFTKHFAMFLLSLREKDLLSETVVRKIYSEISFILSLNVEQLKKNMHNILESFNIDTNLLSYDKNTNTSINNFNSTYKFNNYIKNNFKYIESKSFNFINSEYTFNYISVIDILKTFLFHKDIIKIFDNSSKIYSRSKDSLYDHNLYSKKDEYIRLNLYIDEFEISNPLGSKRGIHKLSAVYFTIADLPLRYRYKDNCIFLCLLGCYKNIKEFDNNYAQFFKPLINDLKLLNVGITVNNIIIKARLNIFSEDNLSLNDIAGYQIHFNNGYFCRNCIVGYKEFRNKLTLTELLLRDSHLLDIDINKGIRHSCIFEQLPYFNINNFFPPDIMHDLLEGIIPITLFHVLKSLNNGYILNIDILNFKLKNIKLPKKSNNKPVQFRSHFFTNGKIIGSASEKLELLYILPQIIEVELIPQNNKSWEIYLLLRKIMDILLSPVIMTNLLSYLHESIEIFLTLFKQTFGENILIPKHHFLLHYTTEIMKYGPLRNIWCMPYERKHKYFKEISHIIKNRINITHSLSERHQYRQCHSFSSDHIFDQDTIGKTVIIDFSVIDVNIINEIKLLKDYNNITDNKLKLSYSITIDSIIYNADKHCVYIYTLLNDMPIFFNVDYIICNFKIFLVGYLYIPEVFLEHIHAYKVNILKKMILISPDDLLDSHPHRIYTEKNTTYAYTKFEINNNMNLYY